MCGVPHNFLGTQPTLTQVPPKWPGLYYGCLHSVFGRTLSVGETAATATDYDQIKFRCHALVLLFISVACSQRCDTILPPLAHRLDCMSNPLLDTSGLPNFDAIKPQHAVPALTELIAAHRQKLDQILADPNARDAASLIQPMEEMSHELGRAWSPVSHLQSVLDDPAWRDAYNQSLPLLTEHGTELSQNKNLQEAYQQVADSLSPDSDPALRTLLDQELRDFRLAGVALPEEKKARYRELAQEMAALQAKFDQNLQDATDSWHFLTTDPEQVAGIPARCCNAPRTMRNRKTLTAGGSSSTIRPIMRS